MQDRTEMILLTSTVFLLMLFGVKTLLAQPATSYLGYVPIGAIFDHEDRAAKTGFLYGITRFNTDREETFQLAVHLDVIELADSFKLAQSICDLLSKGVFMMVGTRKFDSNDIVQSYTQTFHMPYVSASLSDVEPGTGQQYQLHMKPSQTKALVDVIIHFGWRNFHYVYDSEEGLFSIQEIIRLCNSKKYVVTVKMRRIHDVNIAHEDLRSLDKTDEPNNSTQKFILLDLSNEPAYQKIMKQIREVGMNKEGYHYILGTLDFLNLDLGRYQHGGVNITGFQLVNYSSTFVKTFLRKWNTLNSNIWPGAGYNSIHIDAALTFDAITVISKTLAILIENSPETFKHTFRRGDVYNNNKTLGVPCDANPPQPWMHGKRLMRGMKSLHFEGVTGNIEFDKQGLRQNYKFEVYNVGFQYGPEKIGEWSPTGGVYSHQDDEKSSDNGTIGNKVYVVTSIETSTANTSTILTQTHKPSNRNLQEEDSVLSRTPIRRKITSSEIPIFVQDELYGQHKEKLEYILDNAITTFSAQETPISHPSINRSSEMWCNAQVVTILFLIFQIAKPNL